MRRIVAGAIVILLISAIGALAQKGGVEEVLRFTTSSGSVAIQQGGQAEIRIDVANRSIYKAEDIEIEELVPGTFRIAGDPEPIALIDAFSSEVVDLTVEAAADAPLGENQATVEIYYTYCEGELCFQMTDSLSLLLHVEPGLAEQTSSQTVLPTGTQTESTTPPEDPDIGIGPTAGRIDRRSPGDLSGWQGWLIFFGAGLSLAGVLVANGRTALRRRSFVPLVLLGAFLLVGGILFGQHDQARSIGAVLCISCVGIEVAQDIHRAELSTSAVEALASLDEKVHLVVFSAEWCHSCPFAKEMVNQMAEASDRLTYEIIDVDLEPQRAIDAGIVESGRTIVPAILREGSEDVVFGTERLERRLLELLDVRP